MIVDIRTKNIPAKTVTETWYIASDGREFLSQSACEEWERWLSIQEHPVFKTCIKDVWTLDDEAAILYNIRNNEDHQVLMSTFSDRQKRNFSDEYMKYGPGWYIYFSIDGGDGPDFYHLWQYDAYLKEHEDDFNRWKNDMASKMNNALI